MTLKNDCLAILSWCYLNQGKKQTYRILSEECGISLTTVFEIVKGWVKYGDTQWALANYASRFGYTVVWVGKPGEIIFVDKIRKGDGTIA